MSGDLQSLWIASLTDRSTFGTVEEFWEIEDIIHSAELSDNPKDNAYSGPLFVYSRKSPSLFDVEEWRKRLEPKQESENREELVHLRSEINAFWSYDRQLRKADDVVEKMNGNGWEKTWPSNSRYIIAHDDGGMGPRKDKKDTAVPHPKAVAPAAHLTTDQWHIRVFKIGNSVDSGFSAAGQIHFDPWHHGYINPNNTNWQISTGRDFIKQEWTGYNFNTQLVKVGNSRGPSYFDGMPVMIEN
ncbi:hypothetical protein [Halorussus aquaticus]|uniref:hypothetical protein n=1 Tax=Halorussus aquaticus TaxID=2953748 RepID=UPI0020B6DE96|nr:hypothetical protein [Halorussus aquaticus]